MLPAEQLRQRIGIYFPVIGMAFVAGLYYNALYWLAAHGENFKMPAEQMLWLVSTTTCFSTVLSLLLGRLSDHVGRKPLRIVGCIVITVVAVFTLKAYAVWHLYALAIFGSLGMSMFWPATQAELNDQVPESQKTTALARYNYLWSAAVLVSAPAMGYLCDWKMLAPFVLTALITLSVFYAIRKLPVAVSAEKRSEEKLPVDNARERRTMYFLRIAYLSNCVIWGARTALGTLVPAINESAGRSSEKNGICLMLFVLFLFVGFCRIAQNSNWRYKLAPLFAGQILAMVSTILAAVFIDSFFLMTFFLAMTGLGASVTYSSSQYYALDTRRNVGLRAGLHESLLNFGSIVVPLIVSYVAATTKRMDLAFYCVALLIGVGLVAQFILAAATAADRHHGLEQTSQPSAPPAREFLAAEKV